MKIKVCPECESGQYPLGFSIDYKTQNIFCRKCGLVVIAPKGSDFIVPDLKDKEIIMCTIDCINK